MQCKMKKLRYILMVILSLLMIYSGVGVSVCSCYTSEIACFFCSTPCSSCENDNHSDGTCGDSDITCDDEGCTVNVYKVDLTKDNTQSSISVHSFELFCEFLPDFQSVLPLGETQSLYVVPPCSVGSRHYLTLYSTLLI